MNFLKQDKKNHYQILADLFRRNRRGSADATLLLLLKKVNKKVKLITLSINLLSKYILENLIIYDNINQKTYAEKGKAE